MRKWIAATLFIFILGAFNIPGNRPESLYQDKKLVYKDATYELEIRTVQLYPYNGSSNAVLLPAIAPLNNNNLLLEFDDLVQAPENYRVKIIHCNSDWTPSRLRSLDYLYDYNEFNIDNYQLSVDTKLSYVHYKFKIPNIKVPGNYLLVAYRGTDESDIILSKRFMLFSNLVSINLMSDLTGLSSNNRLNQQLDFTINYSDYMLQNPMENVSVVIRQNQRWDNAITTLKPNFIRENVSELEYRFFNYENNFKAGNEFRFFDMRSLRYPGQNVQRANWNTRPTLVDLMMDKPRIYQPYTQYDDLNGEYFIANSDTGNGSVQSDYVTVRFHLKADKVNGEVYVIGEMNNWNLQNQMAYDEVSGMYNGEMILKQGYYDYQYYIKGDTLRSNYFEGDHFQTENEYEILVYYKPPTNRSELLIGYGYYEMNPAR
ncbi:DUF5103 domain-containing protein [Fulvivirga kasyanovii]|uniref:DUF5103 domain-containing protein n=1 Tax=Fulvivirga kasyanovii TaxID=396812 RepID=A0ABW9RPW3_9BACT|nr:type IX secretion system plug protein domain-containing protein [Fulvivirga kasyanovii]MTI26199.1 DUF5103 domain-containing protein [Fulvivirga kasyanovii]